MGLVALMLSSSCKKDEEKAVVPTPTPAPAAAYHFTCKVNGVAFSGITTGSDVGNLSGSYTNTQSQLTSGFNLYADHFDAAAPVTYSTAESCYRGEDGVWLNYKSGSYTITKYDAAKSEVTGNFTSLVFGDNSEITATEGSFFLYMIH